MTTPIEILKKTGLINKYHVTKTDGSPVDEGAEYFCLRLDDGGGDPIHIAACRQAVMTYAHHIASHLPALAHDIRHKYGVKVAITAHEEIALLRSCCDDLNAKLDVITERCRTLECNGVWTPDEYAAYAKMHDAVAQNGGRPYIMELAASLLTKLKNMDSVKERDTAIARAEKAEADLAQHKIDNGYRAAFAMGELWAGSEGMQCEHPGCTARSSNVFLTAIEWREVWRERESIAELIINRRKLGRVLCDAHSSVDELDAAIARAERLDRSLTELDEPLRQLFKANGGIGLDSAPERINAAIRLIYDLRASSSAPLVALATEIIAINAANGWNVLKPEEWADTYKIPAILALIHSEVSEALEDFRKNNREHFDEEIADVIIRCLDLCGGMGIDIDASIRAKLEKNKARGFRHGGKKV